MGVAFPKLEHLMYLMQYLGAQRDLVLCGIQSHLLLYGYVCAVCHVGVPYSCCDAISC